MAIERLSWCCSTRTIGDLRLISDEIAARLADERALFQPWPYLGQERCRRCRGPLRCLLLVILPAAMTAADLCMGRGHCAEEEQQRHDGLDAEEEGVRKCAGPGIRDCPVHVPRSDWNGSPSCS